MGPNARATQYTTTQEVHNTSTTLSTTYNTTLRDSTTVKHKNTLAHRDKEILQQTQQGIQVGKTDTTDTHTCSGAIHKEKKQQSILIMYNTRRSR